jgi:hypothetical protein
MLTTVPGSMATSPPTSKRSERSAPPRISSTRVWVTPLWSTQNRLLVPLLATMKFPAVGFCSHSTSPAPSFSMCVVAQVLLLVEYWHMPVLAWRLISRSVALLRPMPLLNAEIAGAPTSRFDAATALPPPWATATRPPALGPVPSMRAPTWPP